MSILKDMLTELMPGGDGNHLEELIYKALIADIKVEVNRVWSASICHKDQNEKFRGSIYHANAILLCRLLRAHQQGTLHAVTLMCEARDNVLDTNPKPFNPQ